ncbi:MAG: class I SAM-dependent methyltransferase [Candidatus Omnitrophica bacterium]|nr:class I SAM-dependent methyltransferase [Candidatus Omnitrophota bacterium]
MQQAEHNKSGFAEKAVSSRGLTGRIDANRLYAKNDFNLWVAGLLDKIDFLSVLDVCCGTGNQLVLYAARPKVARIVGLDVSKDALAAANERLSKINSRASIELREGRMEDIPAMPGLKSEKFGLASCFYGLYYAKTPVKTLNDIMARVSEDGTVLIVGPYGGNNASLFSLLNRHFTMPELITRSSTTFMNKEVYPALKAGCIVEEERFVNPIIYPDAEALLNYWRASTFYFAEHEDAVRRDIEDHFSAHKEFIVEKHVKAYIGRRKK